jgi:hypothetical protein
MSITRNGSRLVLENPFFRRTIDVEQGPSTTEYRIRTDGGRGAGYWIPTFAYHKHHPFEAAVEIDNRWWQAGPIESRFFEWDRPGAFSIVDTIIGRGEYGATLTLVCVPLPGTPPVELRIHHELADDLPLLIKTVEVRNLGETPLTIQNIALETDPGERSDQELRFFTDYYGPTIVRDDYYRWRRTQFPRRIDLVLDPGAAFTTFRLFQVPVPNDPEIAPVVLHRVWKRLAPWITQNPYSQYVMDIPTIDELRAVAPHAQANGVECVCFYIHQLFTTVGDYIPRPDLFPKGEDDLRRLMDHFHAHELKTMTYCSTTIAYKTDKVTLEHPDWQYLGPDGKRYEPWSFGNMCYQSGWGDYIRTKLDHLVRDLGFDGLDVDGPYHQLPCLAEHHKHRTPDSVEFMNWAWEREWLAHMRARGVILLIPQYTSSLLLGNCAVPGGATETDQHAMGGMPLVALSRARVYDARYGEAPACAAAVTANLENYHGHSIELAETNTATYDHVLGVIFGFGHKPVMFGRRLYGGAASEAVYRKWLAFFRQYRETLQSEMVHLARPDGFHPDGVMVVAPASDPPALVTLFNPHDAPARVHFALPLALAGFAPGEAAVAEGIGRLLMDARAAGLLCTELHPFEVKTIAIRRAKDCSLESR